jgi:hypothetical protein
LLHALALALCLLVAAPASADSPRSNASRERAEAAFQDFARQWMAKVRSLEERDRRSPRVAAGPGTPVFTYRGYGEEFGTELRPTGDAAAPFVGLLHYTQRVYSCRSLEARECSLAATIPVTEIFRYQRGRWTH